MVKEASVDEWTSTLNMHFLEKKQESGWNLVEPSLRLASMHRIIKKAGAERVSLSAASELGKALYEMGVRISAEAVDYAKHSGRKTVKARDVEIAVRKLVERKRGIANM